ncbi:unnamed protein product, partial [Aphanomyces euteiches]
GPWGNSRWEVESYGKLSLESCVEFAWILGCIKYHIGPLQSGQHYIGWVDAKTQDPVADTQVKSLYAENILKHSGIRVVEPELFEGYDPKKKIVLQQVDKNMRPIEVASREEGLESQKKLGEDNCDVFDGSWMLRLRQGAVLSKNLHFNRWVVGQIPIAVDPITLLTLVSTAEALISAGITDPYEFYQRTTPNSFMTTTDQVSIRTDGIKAAFLKSFDIVFACCTLQERNVYLNPLARASYKEKTFGDVLSAKSDVKAVPS